MINKNLSFFLIIACFLFSISGCAFGTRRPTLTYSTALPPGSPKGVSIKVMSFEDKRNNKEEIGYIRNLYGMRCAKVISTNDISEWISNALKAELQNVGYSLSDDAQNSVSGEVIEVFCDTSFAYEGKVMVRVILKKEDEVILDKNYSAKEEEMNWAARAATITKVLEKTLQNLIKQVMFDINNKLGED